MASTLRELIYLGVSAFWWTWTFAWVMYLSVIHLAADTLIKTPPVEFPSFLIGMVVSAVAWGAWYMLRDLVPIPLPHWIAVRTPRYLRRGRIDTSIEHLCSSCRDTMRKSRLLNGTFFVFTRSVEWYEFIPMQEDNCVTFGPSCLLCNELYSSMSWKSRSTPHNFDVTSRVPSNVPSLDPSQTFSLRLKIWQPGNEEGKTYIQLQSSSGHISHAFEAWEGASTSIRDTLTSRDRWIDTGMEGTMNKARHWIQRCSEDHTSSCSQPALFYPSRLVYVGGESKDKIHIVDMSREEPPVCIKYTALSHCWGNGVTFTLTSSNHEALAESFDPADLPLNFQQAISATQSLGYAYIWIDSLCILQDSLEDWAAVSATMGDVYANAVCTISATASDNSQGGCFRKRDQSLEHPFPLLALGSKTLYTWPWTYRQHHVNLEQVFHDKVETAALSQRAWAFQERLLSRRILHFCEGFVFFECNTMRATELSNSPQPYERKHYIRYDGRLLAGSDLLRLKADPPKKLKIVIKQANVWFRGRVRRKLKRIRLIDNPDYLPTTKVKEQLISQSARLGIRGALDMLQSLPTTLSLLERVECHQRWYELVSAYSRRAITHKKDRLIALSGLARTIQKSTKMKYIAGLWKSTLALDLLWTPSKTPSSRPREYIAPSWSWAAIDNEVVSLLANYSKAVGADIGTSMHIEIYIEFLDISVAILGERTFDPASLIDAGYLKISGLTRETSLLCPDFTPTLIFDVDGDTLDCICLLVYSEQDLSTNLAWWCGLLLRPVHDGPPDLYERCGVVHGNRPAEWMLVAGWDMRRITII